MFLFFFNFVLHKNLWLWTLNVSNLRSFEQYYNILIENNIYNLDDNNFIFICTEHLKTFQINNVIWVMFGIDFQTWWFILYITYYSIIIWHILSMIYPSSHFWNCRRLVKKEIWIKNPIQWNLYRSIRLNVFKYINCNFSTLNISPKIKYLQFRYKYSSFALISFVILNGKTNEFGL